MKKGGVIALLTIVAAGLIGVNGYVYLSADRTGPEIQLSSEVTTYDVAVGKDSLLVGVTAVDDKDGDVSDTLRVASVLPNSDNSRVTVTYTAKDSSNNVTKKSTSLAFGSSGVAVDQTAEGETTDGTGEDAAGTESQASTDPADLERAATESDEAAISALAPTAPVFRLTTHYATVAVGDTWHYYDYIASMTDDQDSSNKLAGSIIVDGSVDTSKAGTYEVVYHVTDSNGNESNRAKLTVTVE